MRGSGDLQRFRIRTGPRFIHMLAERHILRIAFPVASAATNQPIIGAGPGFVTAVTDAVGEST